MKVVIFLYAEEPLHTLEIDINEDLDVWVCNLKLTINTTKTKYMLSNNNIDTTID